MASDGNAESTAARLYHQAVELLRDPRAADDVAVLDQAVGWFEQAIHALPPDFPNRRLLLSDLADALQTRYERAGTLVDLDRAIATSREALDETPPGHPHRALLLSNVGTALRRRFEHTGARADLEQAVDAGREAVEATPTGHPNRAGRLSNLGNALQTRFGRTLVTEDLDEAIAVGREAVGAAGADDPGRAGYLSNLGAALQVRFERGGSPADLDEAIAAGQEAVDATPPGHPGRARRLTNLSFALRIRAGRTGTPADLERAIAVGREAVASTPADHPERAAMLSNLGLMLRARYERTGAADDLDEAIAAGRVAVDTTPPDRPDGAKYRSNLAGALLRRFERAGASVDLEAAVANGREALAATPDDDPARAAVLSNLGAALRVRFERGGVVADLDGAVAAMRGAVEATPADHPDRARYRSILGTVLRIRFAHTGAAPDLDQAVTVGRQAVDASPPDHPDRAGRLSNLADALRARFEHGGAVLDRDRAAAAYREALDHPTAPPMQRAQAGRAAAALAADRGDWAAAEAALATVVGLLPVLVDHGLDPRDRQHHLAQLQNLGADAARATLGALGRSTVAWQRLEQARTVLINQALETRHTTDIDRLGHTHAGLADEYHQLREALTGTDPGGTGGGDTVAAARRAERDMIARRRRAADRWPRLLDEIRQVPGFEDFALPPPMATLHEAAGEGTIVAIILTRHGCGALWLTRDDAGYLELPELTAEDAFEHANAFLAALGPAPDQEVDPDELTRVLTWLWDKVTGPVLDRLGHTGPASDQASPQDLPRIWWIPTGPLSTLPLHAAGHHSDPPATRRAVLDRVVSSFTPSVRALADARRARAAAATTVLTVGIDTTADDRLPPLTRAELEATQVARQLRAAEPPLLGRRATHRRVRSLLPGAAWAHFACHAYADNDDPAQSFLALHDRPLRANELFTMRLEEPYLAFLSACTTGIGSLRLLDESIHLGSAFQLAGYPHVIATLWSVNDFIGMRLATGIYTAIQPGNPPAHAVHSTVRAFRDRYAGNPHPWAAHMHIGP
ncbi:CHAT domain-containing protein [Dactylosporangium sp. CA-092794]|uniref:CHAT domain-containing protein n=1 Tax=Dactylosporangium sp. CA-092794 TaxID=3239929 RepID=UPI003D8A383F